MSQQTQSKHGVAQYSGTQEQILVVKREKLFENTGVWYGLNTTILDSLIPVITQHQEFQPRSIMESDARYKQIIPYLVFCHNKELFVMRRKSTSSDQRLASKLSIGIGGHMRQEDMTDGSIIGWARREFTEEVAYNGTYRVTHLGVINDDTNDVGRVHLGIVLLLHGTSNTIEIKDEHKAGGMMSLTECREQGGQFESWSAIILDHIAQHSTLLG